MPNEVIYRVHVLYRCSKAAVGPTFGWQDRTKIFDELHNELNQALEDNDSYYDPYDYETDNYNYDDDSQYNYNPKLIIAVVNNNLTLQEEEEGMYNNIEALEEDENI